MHSLNQWMKEITREIFKKNHEINENKTQKLQDAMKTGKDIDSCKCLH